MRTGKHDAGPIHTTKYHNGIMEMRKQCGIRYIIIKNKEGEVIKSGPQLMIERIFTFNKLV